jgi:hypothetical protein
MVDLQSCKLKKGERYRQSQLSIQLHTLHLFSHRGGEDEIAIDSRYVTKLF